MKKKLLINFFSSGLQAIALQILGLVFFYFISLYLSKDSFGTISWANAVAMFLTTLLSCGMEQVVIRRIAASQSSDWSAAAYFFHALAGSVIMFVGLCLISHIFPGQAGTTRFLPWFFAAQAIMYIGSPLKQYLNAKEKFTPYGVIAVISNLAKIVLAYILWSENILSIHGIVIILIVCALFELLALLIYLLRKTTFTFRFRVSAYTKLLKESIPQYLSVIFDSSLSRMDWILLGIMSTRVATADYSFAYRAYEMARLPVMIIAPLILPRFARLLSFNNKPDPEQKVQINQFLSIEMFFAIGIPLCLNLLWTPLVGALTHGKYGSSNSLQFLILSLCVPFQFFINLLWTISFASRKYKAISVITIFSAVINLVLNLILIPLYGGMGAAIAFLITTVIQGAGYYRLVSKEIMMVSLRSFTVLALIAISSYILAVNLINAVMLRLLIAVVVYIMAAVLLKQIGKKQLSALLLYLRK